MLKTGKKNRGIQNQCGKSIHLLCVLCVCVCVCVCDFQERLGDREEPESCDEARGGNGQAEDSGHQDGAGRRVQVCGHQLCRDGLLRSQGRRAR